MHYIYRICCLYCIEYNQQFQQSQHFWNNFKSIKLYLLQEGSVKYICRHIFLYSIIENSQEVWVVSPASENFSLKLVIFLCEKDFLIDSASKQSKCWTLFVWNQNENIPAKFINREKTFFKIITVCSVAKCQQSNKTIIVFGADGYI